MSLLAAPVQGIGLKIKRYRIYNQQINIVNNSGNGSVNPVVINDTSAVSTTATSLTQVKSYSINIPQNDWGRTVVNAVRVQIYGYVSAGTGNLSVLLNGAAPTMLKSIVGSGNTASFTNTSSALVFDAILSISGLSSPYTLSIQADNSTSGDTTYIADVYGFQGLAITSTTATTIDQQETTPSNTILDEIGLSYQYAGLRLITYINRYTTAAANVQATDQWGGAMSYSLSAANDAANTGIWEPSGGFDSGVSSPTIPVGYNGSMTFTATAHVGASGDVIIIGYCFVSFGFHNILFPKGPHYGFIELTYWAWQYGGLTISDPQYACGSVSGCWGSMNTIFSVSNSNNWIIGNATGTFAIDEDEILVTSTSSNVIYRELLLVILE